MSITDELRKYISGTARCGISPICEKSLANIADRIDAEHESACAEAYGNGVMSVPIALDESAWVKLPKDADGVPIHVGDVMEWVRYEDDDPTIVRNVSAVGNGVFFAWSDEQGRYAQHEAHAYRHYHGPTVEDVLREFAEKITDSQIPNVHPTYEEAIAEYAKRLTLAEGEDA